MPLFEVGPDGLVPFRQLAVGAETYDQALEDILWENLTAVVGEKLLRVRRQAPLQGGGRPAVVALDRQGSVVVVHARRQIDRVDLAECLEYAAWARATTIEEIAGLHWRGPGDFWADWRDFTAQTDPGQLNRVPRLILVTSDFTGRAGSTFDFLVDSGLPVQVLKACLYTDEQGRQLLEVQGQNEPVGAIPAAVRPALSVASSRVTEDVSIEQLGRAGLRPPAWQPDAHRAPDPLRDPLGGDLLPAVELTAEELRRDPLGLDQIVSGRLTIVEPGTPEPASAARDDAPADTGVARDAAAGNGGYGNGRGIAARHDGAIGDTAGDRARSGDAANGVPPRRDERQHGHDTGEHGVNGHAARIALPGPPAIGGPAFAPFPTESESRPPEHGAPEPGSNASFGLPMPQFGELAPRSGPPAPGAATPPPFGELAPRSGPPAPGVGMPPPFGELAPRSGPPAPGVGMPPPFGELAPQSGPPASSPPQFPSRNAHPMPPLPGGTYSRAEPPADQNGGYRRFEPGPAEGGPQAYDGRDFRGPEFRLPDSSGPHAPDHRTIDHLGTGDVPQRPNPPHHPLGESPVSDSGPLPRRIPGAYPSGPGTPPADPADQGKDPQFAGFEPPDPADRPDRASLDDLLDPRILRVPDAFTWDPRSANGHHRDNGH